MKCSKCNYISFDHNENCPKCKKDLIEIRTKMNLPSYCPIIPGHSNFQDQGTAGSIKIEQKGDFEPEENMDIQFTDSQDFESSFDSFAEDKEDESDLDFALATDTDELTLDFDEFSFDDDSDTADMEPEQKTISAGSLEDELDLSFADDTSDTTVDFDEIASDNASKSTMDFENISDEDFDLDDGQSELETIVAGSVEDELDLSFADDTSDMTMDFNEIASDDAGKSTMDFEDLSDEDSDDFQLRADSIEATEKEVNEITLDFEDSISVKDEEKDNAPAKLEVLDLDLDI